jgi:hypothetical protein
VAENCTAVVSLPATFTAVCAAEEATSAVYRNIWDYAVLRVLLKMFTSGSVGAVTTFHLGFIILFLLKEFVSKDIGSTAAVGVFCNGIF